MEVAYEEKRASWLDKPLLSTIALNWELVLFVSILVLGAVTRFYDLGARVMSHDENSHVYYSWLYYRGSGYTHDPITHGPFQFHIVALTYFLFGDNDFTARIPVALFGIATIAFMWNYRRWLGKVGALVTGLLLVISPYMLFYTRYVRNESFVALFGVVMLWGILRYLESGKATYLYYTVAAAALHFTTKETAYIYTAQALIFLGLYFLYNITRKAWVHPEDRNRFLIAVLIALLLAAGVFAIYMIQGQAGVISATETAPPAVPGQESAAATPTGLGALPLSVAALAGLALLVAAFFLLRGYTPERLRADRAFGLVVVLFTMVMPQLAAFPVRWVGWTIPTSAARVAALTMTDIWHIAAFLVPLAIAAIVLGLWWNRRDWLVSVAIFYIIFTVLYTSVFTNGAGFFTGLVGGLGYWLEQQGVNRGNQPWYYYAFVQVPVYEFLPLLGSLLAAGLAVFGRRLPAQTQAQSFDLPEKEVDETEDEQDAPNPVLFLALFGFWAISSLAAYSIAGEKMPWLTVHITLPMIVLAGWSIGWLIERIDWTAFRSRSGWLVLVLLPIFLVTLLATFGSLLGPNPPFQGKDLQQLSDTSTFATSFAMLIASGVLLYRLSRQWAYGQFMRVVTLFFFAFLGLLTMRAAFRAAYINYDDATELLVYAHSAGGVKEALAQIEEISRRTTNGLDAVVAYDDQTSYPYWWYLRYYPNQRYYGDNPTRNLRDAPVILVGDTNYNKIEKVVGQAYYPFNYVRIWWPNQDYFDLNWERIKFALTDPQMRQAIFNIWFNRDYKLYGEITGKDMSLPNWYPSARMRLYVRKDMAAQIWNYGSAPAAEEVLADPYEGKEVKLSASQVIGAPGSEPGQFLRPRDLQVAPDGSIYVADTGNHRIQHLAADGTVLQVWGKFGDGQTAPADPGSFNEPWGLSLGPDGMVYVADTWNHRIQKFTADGQFVKAWGYFGQAEEPEAFWGPRDVVVDAQGRVLVTDTGNKRIVIFDADGNFITQIGGEADLDTDLNEPVGLAMDQEGRLYVADTWNQMVKVFAPTADGGYKMESSWELAAWYGSTTDNKPYIAVDNQGHLFASDPEGYRVLEFTTKGEIVRYWGDYSVSLDGFGLAGAPAVDAQGGVWVSDAGNSRLLYFTLPPQ